MESLINANGEFLPETLMHRMGMRLVTAHADGATVTMPVAGNTQPYGILHGGATAALAETAGSIAASVHAGPNAHAVGLNLHLSHMRSIREGTVTATAIARHTGRTVAIYEITVTDAEGKTVSTASLTCVIRNRA